MPLTFRVPAAVEDDGEGGGGDEDGEVLLVLRREARGAPWGLLAEDGESVAVSEAGQAVVKVTSFSWYANVVAKAKAVAGVVERALMQLPLREVEKVALQARPRSSPSAAGCCPTPARGAHARVHGAHS